VNCLKKLHVRQNWKALTLFLIIVMVALLGTFLLTRLLSEPITIAETTTLETVKWESEKPYAMINIKDNASSLYNGDIMIIQSIEIDDYRPGIVDLLVNITASVTNGYIKDVRLVFRENYENARINFFEDYQLMKLENLSITGFKDWAREISINLTGVNRPSNVYFWAPVQWFLYSLENQTSRLDVFSEVVYFNGAVYKQVVQPFQLNIVPDNNDSFETAQEIHEGYYPRLYTSQIGDEKDYYKIYATEGQRIKVIINATGRGPDSPLFGLYFYDPERNIVVANERDFVHTIDFVANFTGFWFIEIRIYAGHGFYSLDVNQ